MTSEKLQKARDFEKKFIAVDRPEEYPSFHVTGGIGWINDPNGFTTYRDRYHLFYQYHPYDKKWGPMHWGHVVTDDFVTWKRIPAALAPDTLADKDGCFSGSAIELDDGRLALVYTGVTKRRNESGIEKEFQTQCVAFGDGVNFEKYQYNPVIAGDVLPEGSSINDFRDPKVWKENGIFNMVVGSRPKDGSGQILLFQSKDLLDWSLKGIVDSCQNAYGKMWECPDFFAIDGKNVLLTSPQEMRPMGLEFHAGHGTLALIGNFDMENCKFQRENIQAIDYGIDFYAPQTLLTKDGRRIMIGWMQNWTTSNCQNNELRWFGSMTLPRELKVVNGRLIQNPVREIENYRQNKVEYHHVLVSDEMNLHDVRGRKIDMSVTVKQTTPLNHYNWFKLHISKDGIHEATIRIRPDLGTVKIDRSRCGGRFDIVHTRTIPVNILNGEIKLRVIMDGNSVELFINDGEQAATFLLYAPDSANRISFEASGTALIDVEKYDIVVTNNFQWEENL